MSLSPQAKAALARLARRKPRVQCLTNTVAQTLTANLLLAVGAVPSMALHPGEIVAMSESADAVLINLGTLDPAREAAIGTLLAVSADLAKPVVLDPVFVERSPLRLALARRLLLQFSRVILKGNTNEMAVLAPLCPAETIRVITGPVDRIMGPAGETQVEAGHPLMARTIGTGCAAGALIAAFATIEPDPAHAAWLALSSLGAAAEIAARSASGPGSFPAHLVDALAHLSDRSDQS